MTTTSKRKLIRYLGLLAVAVMAGATTARAELRVSLPELAGTYIEDFITGSVDIPNASGIVDLHLIVTGSLVTGVRVPSDGCPSSDPYTISSIVAISLYRPADTAPYLIGIANAPSDDGPINMEILLREAAPPHHSPASLGGLYTYEFQVLPQYWCGLASRLPVVTIESVEVYSLAGVGAESKTWGGVKGLFR